MAHPSTRRDFFRSAALAGTAAGLGRPLLADLAKKRPPSERLRLGVIGVAGRGGDNLAAVSGEEIVALCDVDRDHLGAAAKRFPRAKTYEDFRRVIDRNDVDAVVVSTPDHMHAIPTVWAMRAGKDVYCEKPLAHSVHEVRVVRETAAEQGRVTQMGTQIHAGENYRRVVEILQSGALGPVPRVHVFCSRRPSPGVRVAKGVPPASLNYDLWLGPAPPRPYHPSHLHFVWRWWWDFGGGVLADMGCHYMDLAHWALNLSAPASIEARGEVVHQGDNKVPDLLQVDYRYPARGEQPPVHLTWYHGGWGPKDADGRQHGQGAGVLFEGPRGQLLADYEWYKLLPEAQWRGYQPPKPSIPRSIGHHREWIEAVKTRGGTTCNFQYSGALAEAVLLGNVAYRSGQPLLWDAVSARVSNTSAADAYLRNEYRKGWTL